MLRDSSNGEAENNDPLHVLGPRQFSHSVSARLTRLWELGRSRALSENVCSRLFSFLALAANGDDVDKATTMTAEQQRRDSTFTRQCCVFGLIISWAVGAASLLVGSLFLVLEETSAVKSPQLNLSHTWREVLPLILNVVGMLNDDPNSNPQRCSPHYLGQ